VLNAGDGFHAHPTQALLDAFTLREVTGDLGGRRVLIVDDVWTHGRHIMTVRGREALKH
jgi:aspartate carbamoyltransferase catalytic subunit